MAIDSMKLFERTFIGNRVTDAAGNLLGTVVEEGAYWILVDRVIETAEFEAIGLGWIRLREAKQPPLQGGSVDDLLASERRGQ